MNVFLPNFPLAFIIVLAAVIFSVMAGYLLQREPRSTINRIMAWVLALALPFLLERLFQDEPAGFRMLAIIIPLFFGMKAVAGVESRRDSAPLPLHRWLIFSLFWPGMRPQLFNRPRRPFAGSRSMALYGFARLVIGVIIIALAVNFHHILPYETVAASIWVASALLLVGISLVMHFGLFTIQAAILRRAGFDCRPLFREPLKSETVSEFWSRRWNVAYSEMTALCVYRPITKRLNPTTATLTAFACSGLFHEMAISWPVRAGYGLPMLYFLIQAIAILLEKQRWFQPIAGRTITAAIILLPLPIMFHPWFLRAIIHPILGL